MKGWSQRRLRLSKADTWTQPAHHIDPIVVPLEVVLRSKTKLVAGSEQFVGVHRQIHVRSRRWIHAEEFRRRNAHHGEWRVVDENRLSGRVGGPSETPLTEPVTHDGYRRRSSPAGVRRQQ